MKFASTLLAAALISMAGQAAAQTLTRCQMNVAYRCLQLQQEHTDAERGGESKTDFCTRMALQICQDG